MEYVTRSLSSLSVPPPSQAYFSAPRSKRCAAASGPGMGCSRAPRTRRARWSWARQRSTFSRRGSCGSASTSRSSRPTRFGAICQRSRHGWNARTDQAINRRSGVANAPHPSSPDGPRPRLTLFHDSRPVQLVEARQTPGVWLKATSRRCSHWSGQPGARRQAPETCTIPPSAKSSTPVTKLEASLLRKTAALPISRGSARRPSGFPLPIALKPRRRPSPLPTPPRARSEATACRQSARAQDVDPNARTP